jgi:hypothetical protein
MAVATAAPPVQVHIVGSNVTVPVPLLVPPELDPLLPPLLLPLPLPLPLEPLLLPLELPELPPLEPPLLPPLLPLLPPLEPPDPPPPELLPVPVFGPLSDEQCRRPAPRARAVLETKANPPITRVSFMTFHSVLGKPAAHPAARRARGNGTLVRRFPEGQPVP